MLAEARQDRLGRRAEAPTNLVRRVERITLAFLKDPSRNPRIPDRLRANGILVRHLWFNREVQEGAPLQLQKSGLLALVQTKLVANCS